MLDYNLKYPGKKPMRLQSENSADNMGELSSWRRLRLCGRKA